MFDNIPPWYKLETEFEIAITGPAFVFLQKSEDPEIKKVFKALIQVGKVYARMSPEGKAGLVEAL